MNGRERNYGLDLLKIVSMLGVVIIHIVEKQQGGVLSAANILTVPHETAQLIETACFCAVNCYALISGYLGVERKFRLANLAALWVQVAFYSVLFTVLFTILSPETTPFTLGRMVCACLPVMSEQYWFFSAYFGLFFFMPAINHLLNTMSKRELTKILWMTVAVFSVLPVLVYPVTGDSFDTSQGFSPLWLAILYFIGGYYKKFRPFAEMKKRTALLIYFGATVFTWLFGMALEAATVHFFGEAKMGGWLFSYTSPTMLLEAFALLVFFDHLRLTRFKKFISLLSTLSFSTYLIHCHPLVFSKFMKGRFVGLGTLSPLAMTFSILLTAIVISTLCATIDFVRLRLFQVLRVKERLIALEEKLGATAPRFLRRQG